MPANIKGKKKKYGKSGMVSYKNGKEYIAENTEDKARKKLKPVYNAQGVRVPGMFEDGGAVISAAHEARHRMNQQKGSHGGYLEYMEKYHKGKKKKHRKMKRGE